MLNMKEILNGAKMIRNYRTSYSPKNTNLTRLWLEKAVLRAGGFEAGEGLVISVSDNHVHIKAATVLEMSTHKVHHRKGDPLLDVCNKEVHAVLGVGVKIDIVVKNKEMYIYKEMSFEMVGDLGKYNEGLTRFKKLKVVSLFCGGGAMTSSFVDTQACESVFAVDSDIPEQNPGDYEDLGKTPAYSSWVVETFRHNFPDTLFYWGDIRAVNNAYVPKADIVLISPPCVQFSGLGHMMGGILEHFTFHILRIVLQTGAFAVMFENVPEYFDKSASFSAIKEGLSSIYPEYHYRSINSHDLGSIESRNRGYAVFFKDDTSFEFPEPVKVPQSRRKKVADYLEEIESDEWSTIKGTVMETFLTTHKEKFSHTGFVADEDKLLVKSNDTKVQCFVKGYMKRQTVCSYLRNTEDEQKWRMFTPNEVKSMMHYPSWFKFPKECSKTRQYEILGNSVNGAAVGAIASRIVEAIMKYQIKKAAEELLKPRCLFCV